MRAYFAHFSRPLSVRCNFDKDTGKSLGMAFVTYGTLEETAQLMASPYRASYEIGGRKLTIEYSRPLHARLSNAFGSDDAADPKKKDWLCPACTQVNFARRGECFTCSAPKPWNAVLVSRSDVESHAPPSATLSFNNLHPGCFESNLAFEIGRLGVAPAAIRMPTFKSTGNHKGFAYVDFESVEIAMAVKQAMDGKIMEGTTSAMSVCYARPLTENWHAPPAGGAKRTSDAAAAAIASATMAQQYAANVGWAPKEFDVDAVEGGTAVPESGEIAAQATATAPTPPAPTTSKKQKRKQKEELLPGALASAAGGAEAIAAGVIVPSVADVQPPGVDVVPGYTYDAATGYYRDDSGSGMFYDPKSGLSYSAETGAWYAWDAGSGGYVPVPGSAPSAADGLAGAEAPAKKKPKRSAATIGSAAVIDEKAAAACALAREMGAREDAAALKAAAASTASAAASTAAEVGGGGGGYRDRAAERRKQAAGVDAVVGGGGGAVKGRVYGGKVRGVPGAAAKEKDANGDGAADPFKASVQKVALDRFKAAMG